jgi:hypothetical protein
MRPVSAKGQFQAWQQASLGPLPTPVHTLILTGSTFLPIQNNRIKIHACYRFAGPGIANPVFFDYWSETILMLSRGCR